MENIDDFYDLLDQENEDFDFEKTITDYVDRHCDIDLPLTTKDINDLMSEFCLQHRYHILNDENHLMTEDEKERFVKKQIIKAERSKGQFLDRKLVKK